MRKTELFFAVKCKRNDGYTWIAIGNHGGPALFRSRREANEFNRELSKNLSSELKTVRVTVTAHES
jgi:hypothetical protein